MLLKYIGLTGATVNQRYQSVKMNCYGTLRFLSLCFKKHNKLTRKYEEININIKINYLKHCYFGSQCYTSFWTEIFSLSSLFKFYFVPSFYNGQNII